LRVTADATAAATLGDRVEDLVVRAQGGDREAFASLVHATSDRLYAIATRILRDGDLAEDALQGALVTAWRQLPSLRDPARFEAWVRRLLVHSCYAEARRRRSWTTNVRVLPVDGPVGPDGLLSVVERDALDRAFRRVSVEQRAVFVLHHHLGLSLVEIAETLGIPAGTARSRLHYATRLLRAAVEADAAPVVTEGRMA
jgi:RNA polymerase sigma-70 factor, ECF subfamily